MLDTLTVEERIPDSYSLYRFAATDGFVAIDDEKVLVVEGEDGFSFEEVVREHVEYVQISDSVPVGRYEDEDDVERATEGRSVELKLFMEGTAAEAVLDADPEAVIEEFV